MATSPGRSRGLSKKNTKPPATDVVVLVDECPTVRARSAHQQVGMGLLVHLEDDQGNDGEQHERPAGRNSDLEPPTRGKSHRRSTDRCEHRTHCNHTARVERPRLSQAAPSHRPQSSRQAARGIHDTHPMKEAVEIEWWQSEHGESGRRE